MLIGSQEGLGHLLLAAADHGDGICMTDVAYPSYFGAVQVAGLNPIYMPLSPEDHLPDFDRIDINQIRETKAKIMLLNYPNNPTSATADEAFFSKAIAFCKAHGLLLIHDAPYVDLTFESDHAVSPLSLSGGMDCCIELFSFAKSYHIAGFRLGFALGNKEAIAALESVKAPIDFNQYLGIQRMGITCLGLPRERVRRDAMVWKERALAMTTALKERAGWNVEMPRSCMYLWAKLPDNLSTSDLEFCVKLVENHGVAISPGGNFGPGGKGYVRFALVQPVDRLIEAAARIGSLCRELVRMKETEV
ncbi:hypothetical protein CEUSTIGMA_g6402.t1 [Chlamydomonas eustigma]|uniref:Aminotransferase class I/classII large domain-containing protein n=1 Tax=Chlamydomonas eustigma TaxID=1157962 RepID=A0A250X7V4_9CHLO|nr:hypothetical protein CEUSTIGMA_g6402.t1 [Chlamydomonas eustigma]|eukprot:GAX78962.1 hypothetical protein CEUSTIGMA_g6402.t1 [Chlamydomonas eustigma]